MTAASSPNCRSSAGRSTWSGSARAFPKPTWETKAAAKKKLAELPKGCPIVIDGLAFGVMHEAARELRERNPLIALVHHPLALETGLAPDEAKNFKSSEREALAATRGVVVTSPSTAALLVDGYDVRRRQHHGRLPRHRPRAARDGKQGRHAAAALHRRDRAAQGLRCAGGRARGSQEPALAV